jgi:hypothetical protein
MGEVGPARRLAAPGLSIARRRALAALVAPVDPALAMDILPSADAVSRAACALALGQFDLAQRLMPSGETSQSARYQRGAIAAAGGHWRECRQYLDAAFVADGLVAPLDPYSDNPTELAEFAAPLPATDDGLLVSVIMPARNSASTLAIAARSVLSQSRRNLELLIVDDGSTDDGPRIARSLASEDPRVIPLRNARAPGAYGARNTGIAAARGAFIALQDADDWAHPARLERQLDAMSSQRGLVLGRHFRLDTTGRPVCPRVFPFVRLSPITALFRAEALGAAGPFDEVRVGADSEMIARFDDRFGRLAGARLESVLLVASWRAESLSGDPETGLRGEGWRSRVSYVEDWRRRHAMAPAFASSHRSV